MKKLFVWLVKAPFKLAGRLLKASLKLPWILVQYAIVIAIGIGVYYAVESIKASFVLKPDTIDEKACREAIDVMVLNAAKYHATNRLEYRFQGFFSENFNRWRPTTDLFEISRGENCAITRNELEHFYTEMEKINLYDHHLSQEFFTRAHYRKAKETCCRTSIWDEQCPEDIGPSGYPEGIASQYQDAMMRQSRHYIEQLVYKWSAMLSNCASIQQKFESKAMDAINSWYNNPQDQEQ